DQGGVLPQAQPGGDLGGGGQRGEAGEAGGQDAGLRIRGGAKGVLRAVRAEVQQVNPGHRAGAIEDLAGLWELLGDLPAHPDILGALSREDRREWGEGRRAQQAPPHRMAQAPQVYPAPKVTRTPTRPSSMRPARTPPS